jgi:pimeloyl-ACP methyl ester carboxylesterase
VTTRLTLEPFGFAMQVDDTMVNIAGMWRPGTRTPLVFLHGFGSTKEDYADVVQQVHLADHAVLAFDAPGCGATACSRLDGLSIPFLVDVADRVLASQDVGRFYLIGHSMGGLVGLLLAERHPSRVVGFVNIEGNLAPEDCVFSRQIISDFDPASEGSFEALRDRVWRSGSYSSALFAASLEHKVHSQAVRPLCESLVHFSDHASLLTRFLDLPFPRMLMYGEQNASLTYLPELARHGVQLVSIDHSGHFPMYANAPAMWSRISRFVASSEDQTPAG